MARESANVPLTTQNGPNQPLANDPPAVLRQAVADFARAKSTVDRLAKGCLADQVVAVRCGLPPEEDPTAIFSTLLPFCGRWEAIGDRMVQQVPVDQTIGHSWRWRPEHVDLKDRDRLRQRFLRCTDGPELAEVCWIVPLGLFLAHEGKNRVEFLRSEGVSHYPALTTPYDYPVSHRLSLIQVPCPHGSEWWAVLDQDFIEPVSRPDWTLPFLTAYGVEIVDGWPDAYPPYAMVREAHLMARRRTRDIGRDANISLRMLRERADQAAALVPASLAELAGLRLQKRWRLALSSLTCAMVLAPLATNLQIHDLSAFSAGAGALTMLCGLLFGKAFVVPRHSLKEGRH